MSDGRDKKKTHRKLESNDDDDDDDCDCGWVADLVADELMESWHDEFR